MKLSSIIKELEAIQKREWDIDIEHIISEEHPDSVCITWSNDTLEFYQLPF